MEGRIKSGIRKLATLTMAGFMSLPLDAAKKKVHTIGDSTMQTYSESDTKRGWGQMLQQFFNSQNVEVNNRAKSGASSKSFYLEAPYWKTLVSGDGKMNSGDILVIQFAHNDEKSNGTDGDEENSIHNSLNDGITVDYRGTTPFGTYKDMLRNYIDEAKAMGVKPILCAPISRMYFYNNTIRRNGKHDLGDKFNKIENGKITTNNKIDASDHTMDYVYQMRTVAYEYDDVPFIDMTEASAELYLSYGEEYCAANIFCQEDKTHTSAMGATMIARLFAQLVQKQAAGGETDAKRRAVLTELSKDILLTSDITFAPTSGDMGSIYLGQTIEREFNVSAFGVTPFDGSFDYTVTGDYLISTDGVNYSKNTKADYSGGTLISQVRVKFTGKEVGQSNGVLTVSGGTLKSVLNLSTEVVKLDGEESSVVWPLFTDDIPLVSGTIKPCPQRLEGLKVYNYNPVGSSVWSEESGYDNTRGIQRLCTPTEQWSSGEIDEVSTRFAEFSVEVPEETVLSVDKLSLYVIGAGGNGMRCKVYYSTDDDFANPQQIYANTSMVSNQVYYVEAYPAFELEAGKKLYLRVYPWYNSEATGKTLCLADVTVHGYAKNINEGVVARFDASNIKKYAYSDTPDYPFPADYSVDSDRNAKCRVVNINNNESLYTKDGGTPVVRNRESVVIPGVNGLYQNGFDTKEIAFSYSLSTKNYENLAFDAVMVGKNMCVKKWRAKYSTDGVSFSPIVGAEWSLAASQPMSLTFELPADCSDKDIVEVRIVANGDDLINNIYTEVGEWLGISYYEHSECGVGNVVVRGDMIESQESSAIEGVTDENPTIVEIWNSLGVKSNTTSKGVNIIRMSDGSVRKVVVRE